MTETQPWLQPGRAALATLEPHHLSLLWMPVALLLLAGSVLGWRSATAWIHAVGVGAMGGLILGLIRRASLGHTGRAPQLPRGLPTAFVLMHLAAVVRVAAGLG